MFWVMLAIFVAGVAVSMTHGMHGTRGLPRHRVRADHTSQLPGSEPLSPT